MKIKVNDPKYMSYVVYPTRHFDTKTIKPYYEEEYLEWRELYEIDPSEMYYENIYQAKLSRKKKEEWEDINKVVLASILVFILFVLFPEAFH